MSRSLLKVREQERGTFVARFVRYGSKTPRLRNIDTILLRDVRATNDPETILTDHVWMSRTKGFDRLGILNSNDVIVFDARIRPYVKRGGMKDYRLSHPTNIRLLDL